MDSQTREKIAEFRLQGVTPKGIARRLGLRPAEVSELLREQAARDEAEREPLLDAASATAYISAGWSAGLGVSGPAAAWAEQDPDRMSGTGLASVLWTHSQRYGRVTVCGCLLDLYCLGVKDALGPKTLSAEEFRSFLPRYFASYRTPPIEAPIVLVQSLVLGALDYARALGFEPHPDFAKVRGLLGAVSAPFQIQLGKHGQPYYVPGPHDDVDAVLSTLRLMTGDIGIAPLAQLR